MATRQVLDLSGYRPFREMGRSCELRDIQEFRIHWPELITEESLRRDDMLMRYIRGTDVEDVVKFWKKVYPEVYGSTHQFVFDPGWYEDNVLMDERREEDANRKDHAIILLEDLKEKRLAGILLLTKWDQNLQIELTMGGFSPDFRDKSIFYPYFKSILDSVCTSEVELLTVFAETWHSKTQELMDFYGFKIWGIFPGNTIRWSRDRKCYRACEVHYYKFVNGGERFVAPPEEWSLSEKSKALWETLERLNKG